MKTKEQIEKKKKRIIKTFITIIAIILIGIIAYNLNDYIILDKNKNINVESCNRIDAGDWDMYGKVFTSKFGELKKVKN